MFSIEVAPMSSMKDWVKTWAVAGIFSRSTLNAVREFDCRAP
jgi:hypothetical protein